jgi:hypothetical protein
MLYLLDGEIWARLLDAARRVSISAYLRRAIITGLFQELRARELAEVERGQDVSSGSAGVALTAR